MAKKWNEVQASPEFQAFSPKEKVLAKAAYFNEVIAPQIDVEQLEDAKNEFYQSTVDLSTQPEQLPFKGADVERGFLPQLTTGLAEGIDSMPFSRNIVSGAKAVNLPAASGIPLYGLIAGLKDAIAGKTRAGDLTPIPPEDMPEPRGTPAIIGREGGRMVPDLIAATPFMRGAKQLKLLKDFPILSNILKSGIGFGGYGATKEALKHPETYNPAASITSSPQERLDAVLKTGEAALNYGLPAMAFGAAGTAGSKGLAKVASPLISRVPAALPIAERVGSAAGGAAAGGAMGGEKGATMGALFGGVFPSSSKEKMLSPEGYQKAATALYTDIAKPNQSEIRKIEIGKRRKMGEFFKILAQMRVKFEAFKKAGKNRLDTSFSQKQIRDSMDKALDMADEFLAKSSPKKFDLEEFRAEAKKKITDEKVTATEEKALNKEVDKWLGDEIEKNGQIVDGLTLLAIKNALWKVSYNPLEPNANKAPRRLARSMKEAMSKKYNNGDLDKLLNFISDRATLLTLLQNAHGRIIAGGKLSRVLGALGGSIIGQMMAPHSFGLGPLAGAKAGEGIVRFLSDPSYRSEIAKGYAEKGGLAPEVPSMTPMRDIPVPKNRQLGNLKVADFYDQLMKLQSMLRANPRVPYGPGNVPPSAAPAPEVRGNYPEVNPRQAELEQTFKDVPKEGEGFEAYTKAHAEVLQAKRRMEFLKLKAREARLKEEDRMEKISEAEKRQKAAEAKKIDALISILEEQIRRNTGG